MLCFQDDAVGGCRSACHFAHFPELPADVVEVFWLVPLHGSDAHLFEAFDNTGVCESSGEHNVRFQQCDSFQIDIDGFGYHGNRVVRVGDAELMEAASETMRRLVCAVSVKPMQRNIISSEKRCFIVLDTLMLLPPCLSGFLFT